MEFQLTTKNTLNPIIYELIDAKRLKIIFTHRPTGSSRYREIIHSINDKDADINYRVGNILRFRINNSNVDFQLNKIREVSDNNTIIFLTESHQVNKSTHFILPCLSTKTIDHEFFLAKKYLINAYIDHKETEKSVFEPTYIYLLYRYIYSDPFIELEKRLTKHSNFVDFEDVSPNFVLYRFEIPKEHIQDVIYFISGKYSSFSESLKQKILKFYCLNKDGDTARVLYKDIERKRQLELLFDMKFSSELDLLDVPELIDETYIPTRDLNNKDNEIIEIK